MDRRERNHQWYDSFDEKRMLIILNGALEVKDDHEFEPDTVDEMYCKICGASETEHSGTRMEDLAIPAKFEVCETCDGRGSHVNPSIDSNGLTAEDFDEDPDFREDYFNGAYDQPCVECHGRRVVPVMDMERASLEQIKIVNERQQAHYEAEAERAAAIRYGF